jgi:type I restriction-modification system DNA methylase subunit
METVEDVLQNCTVIGNNVKLPNVKLDRKLYQNVAKKLELIGGKWKSGKIAAFVFNDDPSVLLNQLINNSNSIPITKQNIKKEFQFFETPQNIAELLVKLAEINDSDSILEPSAGQAAIIKELNKVTNTTIDCFELMETNRTILLNSNHNLNLIGDDFLKHPKKNYTKIIANPPFSKNQDIDHILEMYKCLSHNGRLVCITSEAWVNGNQKKTNTIQKLAESRKCTNF